MTDLAPYQITGAQFLAERAHALLADEMGVGKSAQAIRACDLVHARNILIVAPANARINWTREFEKFSPFERPAQHVTSRDMPLRPGVNVLSYALLGARDAGKWIATMPFDVVIFDEAHYLKSRSAQCTRRAYGLRCEGVAGSGGIVSRIPRVWLLSGTPAPNHVAELWTHLHALGVYGAGYYQFVDEFCTGYQSDYGFRITGSRNVDRLRRLLAPFMLRRLKSAVTTLPSLSIEAHTLEPAPVILRHLFPVEAFNPLTSQVLQEEIDKRLATLTQTWRAASAIDEADAVGRLEALAPHQSRLRRWLALGRVPPYIEIIRAELRADPTRKLVIFAVHTAVITELWNQLREEFGAVHLFGETRPHKRQAAIDAFQNSESCRVFVGNIRAAGEAINLTAAAAIDLFESTWTPAYDQQAIMRVHRLGQDRDVIARYWSSARSVEAEIIAAVARKAAALAVVFE